ncbi:hypothetical protein CGLAU_04105 [Corynebacterium glaucum]|uniref:DUF6891 domain-containing protein n=1 Tax=Corynebacterium glaucum TaxID=187491 RepID=A0A1Q2HVB8_9CORY|nr:hypothetical protein [Corynebacterium glaucum]AQQ14797.1 hypothetical protein CGLAU_04105 [Corynebacterium glaucum]
MPYHAMIDSKFPPADGLYESAETSSSISLMLCHGWSIDEITTWVEDDDEPISDPEALVEEVREEYARVIPKASEDAQRMENLREALAKRDLSFSFDEGYDKKEAAEDGAEKAQEAGHKGYAYCTSQDVDTVIHIGELYFGFSSLDNPGSESDAEIGREVFEALEEVGFSPSWNGKHTGRIECTGVVFELPLAD